MDALRKVIVRQPGIGLEQSQYLAVELIQMRRFHAVLPFDARSKRIFCILPLPLQAPCSVKGVIWFEKSALHVSRMKMGPFPHDAPAATISKSNPAGTDGFEFVEFAHPEPEKLSELFTRMGY